MGNQCQNWIHLKIGSKLKARILIRIIIRINIKSYTWVQKSFTNAEMLDNLFKNVHAE